MAAPFSDRERRMLESVAQDPALSQEARDRAARLLGGAAAGPQSLVGAPQPGPSLPGAVGRPLEIPTGAQMEVAGGMAAGLHPSGRVPYLSAIPAGLLGGIGGTVSDLLRYEFENEPLPSPGGIAGHFLRPAAAELATPPLLKGLGWTAGKVGLTRALTPVGRELTRLSRKWGIPLTAADVTHKKPTAMLENFPNYFWLGSGFIQRFRRNQLNKAGEAAQGLAARHYQGLADRITAARLAKGGLREAVRQYRAETNRQALELEKIAGHRLVDVDNLKAQAKQFLKDAAHRPYGAPTGAAKMAKLGEKEAVEPEGRALVLRAAQENVWIADLLDRVNMLAKDEGAQIPFWEARQIRTQLAELSRFRRKLPIGTVKEGEAAALYNAIDRDIDNFLTSPAQADMAPLEREFRAYVKAGKELFNESVAADIKKTSTKELQSLPGIIFRPDAPQNVMDVRKALPEPVYQRLLASWFQSVLRKSAPLQMGERIFKPSRFVAQLEPFVREGTIDVMFDPAMAQEIREIVTICSTLQTAEAIAGNPSGTTQAFLGARQVFDALKLIGLGLSGNLVAGGPGALSSLALPGSIGKFVTSQRGQRFLTEGFTGGPIKRQAVRLGAHVGAQQARSEKQEEE